MFYGILCEIIRKVYMLFLLIGGMVNEGQQDIFCGMLWVIMPKVSILSLLIWSIALCVTEKPNCLDAQASLSLCCSHMLNLLCACRGKNNDDNVGDRPNFWFAPFNFYLF